MITMDGTPQIRTRANTVAGTPLSSVSANRSSTNGGNVYKMADLHQKLHCPTIGNVPFLKRLFSMNCRLQTLQEAVAIKLTIQIGVLVNNA